MALQLMSNKGDRNMKKIVILVFAVLFINITGSAPTCATHKRQVLTGGLVRAAAGATIGAMAGNAGMGALIGGAAGSRAHFYMVEAGCPRPGFSRRA